MIAQVPVYGTGMYRVASILMLITGGVTPVGTALDRIRSRPKRRRGREQDAGHLRAGGHQV
ncbi:hypothetical protein ACFXKC_14955 [Streptomyces sp. NPDC059340]|uniref:hypothetical protein n=1 Tax=Streptomyces sp. NPDC059340 TaxID=3346806 RepID=UPI003681FB32